MALSWIFKTIDQTSRPAKDMAGSVADLDKRLRAAADALGGLDVKSKEAGHGAEHAHGKFAGFIHTLHDGLHVIESLHRGFEFLKESFETSVIEPIRFKEGSLLALEALTHSGEKAKEIFEQTEYLAGKTGVKVQTLMESAKDLSSAGFTGDDVFAIQQMIGDVSLTHGAGKAAAMSEAIADMGRNGIVTERALMSLKHVLDMDALAKQFGTNAKGMRRMIESGLIQPFEFTNAVVRTAKDTISGGELGSVMVKWTKTLPGALDRMQQAPELFFSKLAGFSKKGDFKDSMAKAINNVTDVFTSDYVIDKARSFVDELGSVLGFSGKGGLLASLTGPDATKTIREVFDKIFEGAKAAIPVVQTLANAAVKLANALQTAAEFIGYLANGGNTRLDLQDKMDKASAANRQDLIAQSMQLLQGAKSPTDRAFLINHLQKDLGVNIVGDDAGPKVPAAPSIAGPQATSSAAGRSFVSAPTVNVHVDAAGATKADAEHIAGKVADHTRSALNANERLANEAGF